MKILILIPGVHPCSSEPSRQSSSKSQTHRLGMQRWLLQVNWSGRQVGYAGKRTNQR